MMRLCSEQQLFCIAIGLGDLSIKKLRNKKQKVLKIVEIPRSDEITLVIYSVVNVFFKYISYNSFRFVRDKN